MEKIKELTGVLGAHSVVEAVGAIRSGGHLGYIGVNYDARQRSG